MSKSRKIWNIVLTADWHVGSMTGLTSMPKNDIQKALLAKFKECAKKYNKPDILVINGDAIDGDQRKSGGAGLTEADIREQEKDVVNLIKLWEPKEVFLVSGTSYHVGIVSSEAKIADTLVEYCNIKATYLRKLNLTINNWFKLQARHFIGGSNNPAGRATASGRSNMWEILNAYKAGTKAADLSVFAHVHYYDLHQSAFGTTIVLPCFQAHGTPYGDEKCDGHIDIGVISVKVGSTEKDGWTWEKELYSAKIKSQSLKR